ncbi:hypothetical protein [Streptomyces paromomycinus]|uniref:Uncharacterized protein n=1 Tax=Streptomyces paromomycinus TaxID=92743 RepID=A0A401VUS7_STREY|nr:hypothetical protein [Streptomyces paromomycinus]GCD40816.1 hypothetical protein GKJPGBOP_00469 [Streptomyces paromomycinus]
MSEQWAAPPGNGSTVMPIGDAWDVVEVPAATAEWACQLRHVEAPAIVDPRNDRAWWLIPRGSADPASWLWQRLQPAVVVRDTGSLIVPHAGRTEGLRWARPRYWSGVYLAQPQHLAAVLNVLRNATDLCRASVPPFHARGGTDAGPG